jgi:hypothetical protein
MNDTALAAVLYPPLEPNASGRLAVSELHDL